MSRVLSYSASRMVAAMSSQNELRVGRCRTQHPDGRVPAGSSGNPDLGGTGVIGGYWTRSTTVEVDLVGVDRRPNARKVTLAGSVKWREHSPFGRRDLADLIEQRAHVPGAADAALVSVSRSGFAVDDLDRAYTPADLIAAWNTIS
jgi:uncharacterized protein